MTIRWILLGLVLSGNSLALGLDGQLDLIKKVYDLHAKACGGLTVFSDQEAEAGKLLFESKALSGDKDISCRSCHLDRFGSADGLPLAVGIGGKGEGEHRYEKGGALVQRNALSLKGRGNPLFKTFFWDGKAQIDNGEVVTQFGLSVNGFKTALAAAAILPLIERDEFIGKTRLLAANTIQRKVGDKIYDKRYQAVGAAIRQRLLSASDPSIVELRNKLESYGVALEKIELSDIGNQLAAFITKEFPCEESAWDQYLQGDHNTLTPKQKRGAILFFGKGRCASCHQGEMFSDFDFHSIGVPQGLFGPHSRHRDIGRAGVTNRREDLFKFRTPPLIGVSETAPYGHNGAFNTLKGVITHHFNPLAFYIKHDDFYDADYYEIGRLMDSRDRLLGTMRINSDDEIKSLIAFLRAL